MASLIPSTAAPFFQEYDLDELDSERDSSLVIERILAYGNRAELRWLFHHYGLDSITAWIFETGRQRLPWRRYNLWCVVFDLPVDKPRSPDHSIWPY